MTSQPHEEPREEPRDPAREAARHSRVAVVRCESYDTEAVHEAVGRGLGLLGGAETFVMAPGEKVLLKPNLLVGAAPDECVTTHPAVFRALAEHLRAAGAALTYGDSPGFGKPETVARRAGLTEVASDLGIALADFSSGRQVSFPEGDLVKSWFIASGALDADAIVSLPKMKTHKLTRITGAVKNQFGCVSGIRKGEFHARMREVVGFSRMLVDLARFLSPRLHVMDGIVAMQGNGPRGGDPRAMNVLLLSADPIAMDATFCRLIGLDHRLVDTVTLGEELGLGTATDIEWVGDELESFIAPDFDVDRSLRATTATSSGPFAGLMRRFVVPRPFVVRERCTSCGMCIRVCPVTPKAVDWERTPGEHGAVRTGPPVHDYARCIRCYCCQEMCPEGAIEVSEPLVGRIIHR